MTTITLIRHGQASFGARNYDELSATGRQQAEYLGRHWAACGQPIEALNAYAGSLSRQQDTARIALDTAQMGAEVQVREAFNEYPFEAILRAYLPVVAHRHPEIEVDAHTLYSQPRKFQLAFEKAIGYWLRAEPHAGHAVETWRDFCGRVEQGLRTLAQSPAETRHAVFTSGGVIAVALKLALNLSDETAFQMNWRIYNASVHEFRWGRNGLSLLGFNNIAHLQVARAPELITFR